MIRAIKSTIIILLLCFWGIVLVYIFDYGLMYVFDSKKFSWQMFWGNVIQTAFYGLFLLWGLFAGCVKLAHFNNHIFAFFTNIYILAYTVLILIGVYMWAIWAMSKTIDYWQVVHTYNNWGSQYFIFYIFVNVYLNFERIYLK
jgi:hypothetical protein